MGESNKNKNIVLHLVEEFNRHNLPVLEEMYRNCVYHSSIAGELKGEAHRQFLSHLLAAFPDGRWTIDDQIAEGDEVVTRWSFSGTAPTGKKVAITGIVIDRIVDGRIVDEWEETSSLFFPITLSR